MCSISELDRLAPGLGTPKDPDTAFTQTGFTGP
jgi:hypothetical protein